MPVAELTLTEERESSSFPANRGDPEATERREAVRPTGSGTLCSMSCVRPVGRVNSGRRFQMPPDTAWRGQRPGSRTSVCVPPSAGLIHLVGEAQFHSTNTDQVRQPLCRGAPIYRDESRQGLQSRSPWADENMDTVWEGSQHSDEEPGLTVKHSQSCRRGAQGRLPRRYSG